MQWRRWIRVLGDATRRAWPALLIGALVVALGIGAVVYPGKANADLHLNDDMVYVTKADSQLLGHVNGQINDLAASAPLLDRSTDVLQSGGQVLTWNQTANQLASYDPVLQSAGAPVALPSNAVVGFGAGTLAVMNQATGKGWNGPVNLVLSTDMKTAAAQFDLGAPAQLVVTTSGHTIALVPSRAEVVHIDADGKKKITRLPFVLGFDAGKVQLSAVGDKAVVLDGNNGQFWIEGDSHASNLPGGNAAVLATPAPGGLKINGKDVRAVVATAAGLSANTRPDEFVLLQQASGTPIRPAVVGNCAYGSAGSQVQIACSGQQPHAVDIPRYSAGAELRLRYNRGVVALNEPQTGRIWMINAGMKLITDWQRVTPPKPQNAGQQENDETQKVNPDRAKPNRPPVAKPDDLTVRAGRSTMLDLLGNDYDPDGDILVVSQFTQPSVGSIDLVRGGTQVQYTAPPDAVGQAVTFRYTIDDGRGGTAQADVVVHVVSADQKLVNTAPTQTKQEPHVIAQNGQFSTRVLLDWKDPEGDDMVVIAASMADTDDIVTFTPDGVLTYIDVGKKTGLKTIKVTVSDGRATTDGVVVVDVRKSGQIPPVANGDYYQAEVGQDLVVRPLDNDQGSNLVLSFVNRNQPGASVVPDFNNNTFHFTPHRPGTYYVDYVVSSGPTAFGLVRIDVKAPGTQNRPPIAVRDVALLPMGGSVLVDPLLNDEDPDNDVLVLQAVSADPHLQIQMSERHLLSIKAIVTPPDPITLTYWVSDGAHSVPGTLVVIPAPQGADTRPIAVNDEVTVRAGATATVHVLQNDYSPTGSKLTLDKQLVNQPLGYSWVDGEDLRYVAPAQAGQYQAIYQIHDELGQVGSAVVRFTVVAADAENRAPDPKEITGRALSGTRTRIPIPVDGIDPNGDAVRLLGLDSGPQLGRITTVGDHWLEYESYPNSRGTDTFSYTVTDSLGAKAVGQIRVGVAAPTKDNNQPTAIDDKITVRPHKTVRIPVLTNDYDQDGDRFGFAENALKFPVPARVVSGSEIEVDVGEVSVQGTYMIEDARGGRASANVIITVDPKAPALPPEPRDDQVSAAQVAGQDVIDVPVLANDVDPDGNLNDATVTVPQYPCPADECATVPKTKPDAAAADKVVRVHVGSTMQQIRYEVKDSDGLVGTAVITVPGNADATPALRGDIPEVEVTAGEPLELDVNQYVIGTKKQKVVLTADDRVWASAGQARVVNPTTVRFTSAASYAGPAAVVFEVTDGKNTSDPAGKKAVLSIPIKVKPRPVSNREGANTQQLNNPPVAPSVTLQVGAGEPERSVDLTQSASDPDGDKLSFSQPSGAAPAGVSIRWDGLSKLTASANVDTPPGTQVTMHGDVTDSRGGSTPYEIHVLVVPTSAPRASVSDDLVPDANQGKEVTVSPLANDTSPWPDKPLTLVSAVVEAGTGSTPVVDGNQVRVTPGPDFVGNLVVRYTVSDATKLTERYVDGRIRITVRGRPGQPQTPRLTDTADINHKATITWPAANDNGAPIQKYTVTGVGDNGSQVTQDCPSTTCTIVNLTNGVTYTFTVTATNEVGTSLPSAPSAGIKPDQKPPAPPVPRTKFGDKSIQVDWDTPRYDGSPVVSFDLEVRSADVNTVKSGLTGNSLNVTGLTNGSAYTFRVRATNSSQMTGEWSDWSPAEVPAGLPGKPASVTATDVPENTGGKAVLTWAQADPNGDDPNAYFVTIINNDGSTRGDPILLTAADYHPVAGSGNLTATISAPNGDFSFAVAARNKAGTGGATNSPRVTIFASPDMPAVPTLSGGDGTVRIQVPPARANGGVIASYIVHLSTDGGAPVDLPFPSAGGLDKTIGPESGIRNGYGYTASVSVCAQPTSGGAAKCSAASDMSSQVVPAGPMGAPRALISTSLEGSWKRGARNAFGQVWFDPPTDHVPTFGAQSRYYSNGNPVSLGIQAGSNVQNDTNGKQGVYFGGYAGEPDRQFYYYNLAGNSRGPETRVSIPQNPITVSGASASSVSFQLWGAPWATTAHCHLATGPGSNNPSDIATTDLATSDGEGRGSGTFTAPADKPFNLAGATIYCTFDSTPGFLYSPV